ncbi:MAG: hypothetical protein ACOYB2_19945 [Limnohabitans sp.]
MSVELEKQSSFFKLTQPKNRVPTITTEVNSFTEESIRPPTIETTRHIFEIKMFKP